MAVLLTGSSTPSSRSTSSSGTTSKSKRRPRSRKQRDVALAIATEVEVLTDDDGRRGQPVDEHPLDELARRLLRLSLVERQHDGGLDAGLGEQLEALLGIGEQLRCRFRSHDRGRVTVEREHRRVRRIVGGDLADVTDHGLMAEVDAVVGADRDHGSFAGPGGLGQIGDDTHSGDATRLPVPGARRTAWLRARGTARTPPATRRAGRTRPTVRRPATPRAPGRWPRPRRRRRRR